MKMSSALRHTRRTGRIKPEGYIVGVGIDGIGGRMARRQDAFETDAIGGDVAAGNDHMQMTLGGDLIDDRPHAIEEFWRYDNRIGAATLSAVGSGTGRGSGGGAHETANTISASRLLRLRIIWYHYRHAGE